MLLILLVWLAALGPAYVASWSGCWSLLDLLLLPGSPLLSSVVSLAVGLAVGFPLVFLHQALTSAAAGSRPLAVLHHLVGLEVQVLLWRGSWMLLDSGLGAGSVSSAVSGLVTAAVMAGTGCLPTAGAGPPVPEQHGAAESTAESAPTPAGAVAHALLTLLPVLAGCVLVWHGVWGVLDGWAPPDAPLWVTLALLAVSTLAVALLSVLPHCLGWVAADDAKEDRPGGMLRRLREDLLATLMTVSVVGYWKGLFDLMERLAVADFPWLAGMLLMVIGFAVVALTGHSARTYEVGRALWNDGDLRWLRAVDDQEDEAVMPLIGDDDLR